jgi:hypothetical protein
MPRSQTSNSKPNLPALKHPHIVNPMSSVAAYTPPAAPTFGQVVKEGFAFGTGSAIAHRIFGPASLSLFTPKATSEIPCDKERVAFETCMKTKSTDDYCGNEQMAYTHCIQLKKKE